MQASESKCRGRGGLAPSHANEAMGLDWKGVWAQIPVPAVQIVGVGTLKCRLWP